jgi:hypothetical protein
MTITLYTMSWNGYWDKYKDSWCEDINKLNTTPDEIIIVSDVELDTSLLKNKNVKNIIVPDYYEKRPASTYRNIAADNATSEWIVSADIDDEFDPSFLDNLPNDSDIHGFLFQEKGSGQILCQDSKALEDRLSGIDNPGKLIPGCSPIKKSVFANIKYEHNCHEDAIFYAMASKLNINFTYDSADRSPRYYYSGWNSQSNEMERITRIYKEMISGSNRPVYAFWFSESITDNRARALEKLRSSSKNLVLLNTEEFLKYSHPELPIHEGFRYLTDNHKSDYARAYMMYFYGGGYSDIKPNEFDWDPYFDQLFLSRAHAIGYANTLPGGIPKFWDNSETENEVINNFYKFIGFGHFIFKPKTDIAYQWITEIHKKMDQNYDKLRESPGVTVHIGDPEYEETRGGYPFAWADLGAAVLLKLQYENNFPNIILDMPFTNNINYR